MRAAIITGTREAEASRWYEHVWDGVLSNGLIIEGGARGIDAIAKGIARQVGLDVVTVPAMWKKQGDAAGPIRNGVMLEILQALSGQGWHIEVRGYHDALHDKSGTYDMMSRAFRDGVTVFLNNEEWVGVLPGEKDDHVF